MTSTVITARPIEQAKPRNMRIAALRRFALAITIVNVIGHTVLGFEMAYAHPFIALATAYVLELFMEWLDARLHQRSPAYLGSGVVGFIDFLLPGHITALACAMLLYTNQTFTPIIFAVAVGVCSKFIFRVPAGNGRTRHFFNPSNTGIAVALLVFPWVGVAPPYQFTEHLTGVWDWVVPCVVICTGTFLNSRFTRRIPLILAWVGGFIAQALIRAAFFDFSLIHALSPMTGAAFVLFTFYMISDPGTTPFKPRAQVIFGLSVALLYMFMDLANMVYQIFFALIIVCIIRGIVMYATDYFGRKSQNAPSISKSKETPPAKVPAPVLTMANAPASSQGGKV